MLLNLFAVFCLAVVGYLALDLYRECEAQSRRVPVPVKRKTERLAPSRRIWR